MLLRICCGVLFLSAASTREAWAQLEPGVEDTLPQDGQQITLTDTGRVELHVADLPLSKALQMLSLQGRRNIIASPQVQGTVTANLYGVTFMEALDALLRQNGAGYRRTGNFIYVYTNEELAEMEAVGSGPLKWRVFRLNYLSAKNAKRYITPLLDEDESVTVSPPPSAGVGSDAESGGADSSANQDIVIVRATLSKLREVERLLKEVDLRPLQVLIEATILRAALTDDNSLGIDFSIVGGVDLAELGASSNGLADLQLGALPQDRFERFNSIAQTALSANLPDGGLTIGILKDKVAVFLRALEEVTDTTVLANPKVLALNKQRGQVIVGRRDGFLTTTVTETQAIQSVEFLETGTQLIFRPFISDDGFVRLELHPEDSVGFVNAQGLPSEQTTEVTTNVILRDGETILIGGLFREVTTDARRQVPGIGNLPILGPLFRSRNDTTTREEVIILLTVHIVKDHARYASASLEQLNHVERFRVGLRRGLMWHGRERLAQTYYRKATEQYHEGDAAKAIWYANLALNNNSRMLPAILLKERILQTREWYEDASGGRGFLHRLIARERGDAGILFQRPGPPFQAPADTPRPSKPAGEEANQ